ncbi:hypothetical protein CC2G_012856 [Coprinopsis cinerea AmutBmut pab1-1]|nr:hypothetical protein CC2G_012856 [Coprinopsis cinerea AmutBmut pab1-1]
MTAFSSFYLSSIGDLPTYSQSVPAPSYSYEPACDEQVLQHTPSRLNAQPNTTGTFIRKSGKTTIILTEQEDGSSTPAYGRHGVIDGVLLFEENELITEVEFEIEGKLDSTISEGGGKSTRLLFHKETLWAKQKSSPSADSCPSQLPIRYSLPTTFLDGDTARSLPPSYTGFFQGIPTLFVKASYTIRVRVTRLVTSKLGFWTKTKHIIQPIRYHPRARPHRPIYPSPGFFSSIKTSPEEWFQASSSIKTRESSSLDPLPVHLFIPAGRVYGLQDTIPFHLQISGPVSSLKELFMSPSGALDRVLSSDSRTTASSTQSNSKETKSPIRVYLMRQVTVEVRGEKAFRNTVIGEGSLTAVPPLMSSCWSATSSDCAEEHLDWEGTLKCDPSITVGGFIASNVQVKEFVMLNVTPQCPWKSPLLDLQLSIPIRLTTESYGEVPVPGIDSFVA